MEGSISEISDEDLEDLKKKGLVKTDGKGGWWLTPEGAETAKELQEEEDLQSAIGEYITPNDFLSSLHQNWCIPGDESFKGMRIFPLSFTLKEDSGSSVLKNYGVMGAGGIEARGRHDVNLTIETILIPQGSPVPEGCDGFDHLPCLNALWPLYVWELDGMKFSGPAIAPPALGSRATIVDVEQTLDIQLVGLGLDTEARECRSCEKNPCECHD